MANCSTNSRYSPDCGSVICSQEYWFPACVYMLSLELCDRAATPENPATIDMKWPRVASAVVLMALTSFPMAYKAAPMAHTSRRLMPQALSRIHGPSAAFDGRSHFHPAFDRPGCNRSRSADFCGRSFRGTHGIHGRHHPGGRSSIYGQAALWTGDSVRSTGACPC